MWKVEFDDRARKELQKLDPDTQECILNWLRQNIAGKEALRSIGKPLRGHIKGLWRYRVGFWRIIGQIQDEKLLVLVL